jgi:ATP-binding cassette subfamily B protein
MIAFISPVMMTASYVCVILVSWLGAKIIVESNMTTLKTGELMTLLTYSFQILMSLMMLAMVTLMLTISRASAERIVEVLDEVPDIKNPDNPV